MKKARSKDITKRKEEEMLKHKLALLSQPEIKLEELRLTDVVDKEILQKLQDTFAERNHIASVIFENNGEPITEYSNFSDFCKLVRSTKEGLKRCKKSDARLGRKAAKGIIAVEPCGNLKEIMDGVVPIIIQGKRIANWGIGQAVTKDIDENEVRKLADEIGLDREELVKASRKLTRMSKEHFEKILHFLNVMAMQVSLLGFQVLQQAHLTTKLKKSEEKYSSLINDAIGSLSSGIFILDKNFKVVWINKATEEFFGIDRNELIGTDKRKAIKENIKYIFEHPDKFENTIMSTYKNNSYIKNFECHILPAGNRKERFLEHWSTPIKTGMLKGGRVEHYYDITKRKEAEQRLKHISLVLRSIRKVNQLITRERNVEKLIQSSCRNLVKNQAYYSALIGLLDKSGKVINTVASYPSKECKDIEELLKNKLPNCVLQAMKQKELVIIKNPSVDCGEHFLKDKCKNSGVLIKRLEYRKKIYGFIYVKVPYKFIDSREEQSLFNEVSKDIAFALYRMELEEKEKHLLKTEHNERLRAETLAKVAFALTSKMNLSDIFKEILKQAKRIVPNTNSNIALLKGNALHTVYTKGYEQYKVREYVLKNVQPLNKYKTAYEVVKTKKPLIVFDTTKDQRWILHGETPWVRSHLSIPICTHNEVLGILRIDSNVPNKFSKEDAEKLVPLANAAAIAIENSQLFNEAQQEIKERRVAEEKLQSIMQDIIYTIAKIAEMRDPYTTGHQKRVAQLAVAIAKEMKLPENRIEGLRVAALLHDIGKINIPLEILTKPAKLTKLEYALVKNHPKDSYEMLKNVAFPWPVAKIVLQHHEKINGSGYPQGLTNKDIMLEAKILCIADVVEAMCSDRPYRSALKIEEALNEIEKNKGILYDAKAADACIKLFKERGFKFKKIN